MVGSIDRSYLREELHTMWIHRFDSEDLTEG